MVNVFHLDAKATLLLKELLISKNRYIHFLKLIKVYSHTDTSLHWNIHVVI